MFHRRRRCRVAAGGKQPHYYPPYSTALPSAASQPLHDRIRLLEADCCCCCCCCCCCFRVVITIIIIVALPLPLPLPCIYLLFYTYGRTDAQFHILHFNYKLQRRAEQSRAVDRHLWTKKRDDDDPFYPPTLSIIIPPLSSTYPLFPPPFPPPHLLPVPFLLLLLLLLLSIPLSPSLCCAVL